MERYMIPGGDIVKCEFGNKRLLFTVTARDPVLGKFIGAGHDPMKDAKSSKCLVGLEIFSTEASVKDGGVAAGEAPGRAKGKITFVSVRGASGFCDGISAPAVPTRRAKEGEATMRNDIVGEMPIQITVVHQNVFAFNYQGELCGGMSGSPILQDGALVGVYMGRNTKKENEGLGLHIEDAVDELLLGKPGRHITEIKDTVEEGGGEG